MFSQLTFSVHHILKAGGQFTRDAGMRLKRKLTTLRCYICLTLFNNSRGGDLMCAPTGDLGSGQGEGGRGGWREIKRIRRRAEEA